MKFMFLDDLKASLVGRLMIRNFVKEATGMSNSCVDIKRDDRGKPYLPGDYNLDFNVSHQGGFAVLAGCYSQDQTSVTTLRLGVDVMKMEYSGGKSIQEFFRLMDRNFTIGEWRYIKSGRDREDLIGRFMRVWCLKESYVKNIGVGITVDLREIDFNVRSPLSLSVNEQNLTTKVKLNGRNEVEGNWHFEETRLDEEHCVAVAVSEQQKDIDNSGQGSSQYSPCKEGFRFIDVEWLIENIDPLRSEAEISEEMCKEVLNKERKRQ